MSQRRVGSHESLQVVQAVQVAVCCNLRWYLQLHNRTHFLSDQQLRMTQLCWLHVVGAEIVDLM